MGVVVNGLLLLVFIFIINHIKLLIQNKASNIPLVTSTWSDGLKGKSFRAIIQTGYDTYSKTAKTFRTKDVYILPPSLFAEFRRLPSTVMNSSSANEQVLKLQRNLGGDYWDIVQFVRQDVIRSLPSQIPIMREEIKKHFSKKYASEDGGWRDIVPWSTTFEMMSCFASRLLVGNGLSQNEVFIKKIGEFTRSVTIECILLQQLPEFLTSLVGPLLPGKNRVRELTAMLREPILACVQEDKNGSLEMRPEKEYYGNSLLPQLVAHVLPKCSPSGRITEATLLPAVAGRLLGLLFAVIDTTTMTFTQSFFDLVSNPHSSYAATLKSEIRTVLAAHNNEWTQASLSELIHLDSFIHESQRLHPVGPALAARKCLSPSGWTFSNGDFIPYGSMVKLPVWPVHIDTSSYADPDEFQGFRFVDATHPESMPSDHFLAFGHGNHACPGRRFALIMIKLMIVEILTEYDFEELKSRPEDWNFGSGIVPDMKREVRMRRKAHGEHDIVDKGCGFELYEK